MQKFNDIARQPDTDGDTGGVSRRAVLRGGGALGVGAALLALGLLPHTAHAADERPPFVATTLADALAALGAEHPARSDAITIQSPDMASNGAVVDVTVTSKLPGTREIVLLVSKNPNPLAARLRFPEGTQPLVKTRVKMAQSGDLVALVYSDEGLFMAQRPVAITVGGCGA